MQKILIFYVEFTKKKNSFLSFHSQIFHLKIHKRRRTFFERERTRGGGGWITHKSKRNIEGEREYM